MALDPAPDGDVINRKVPLGHDLLQVAIAQGISQVPTNTQEDDHVFEVPPAEQCWPFSSHDPLYQISSTALATEPAYGVVGEINSAGNGPVILVGHSMAGVVLNAVGELLGREQIAQLVYITA